ncbi:MAG: phosphatase PAP2 family protein [Myxococcales bacterium]|nr:MAG: phosphatase PAP2 family protein [Myxococcales bacterium]
MQDRSLAAKLLFGASGMAALAFGAFSLAVARGKTARWDRRAKRRSHDALGSGDGAHAVRSAARAATPLGKWWGYLPASLGVSLRLLRAGRGNAAFTIAGSALGAALLPPVLERVLPHRAPPPERGEPAVPSYPSGHALQTSAVALTTGYVLWREQLAPSMALVPLSAASVVAGLSRFVLDRHWTSDLVGGYLAGVAFGAACAGGYELART